MWNLESFPHFYASDVDVQTVHVATWRGVGPGGVKLKASALGRAAGSSTRPSSKFKTHPEKAAPERQT